ncbi:MAG: hypothetical protein Q4G71_10225 [Pseudomonadota bacterium]|nr:hypothetical protein [Pseudomonadota bacterium]
MFALRLATLTAAASLLAGLALPLPASAQAYRCPDPATGRVSYTDQPCKGGALIAPRRSEEELRQEAAAAQAAREREAERQQLADERERQRQQAAHTEAAARAPASPAESADCRAARAQADALARSPSASQEQLSTARYNAALACGQPPPGEVVVVQPPPPPLFVPVYPYPPHHGNHRPPLRPAPPPGPGFGMPTGQPTPAQPGRLQVDPPRQLDPIPVNVRP